MSNKQNSQFHSAEIAVQERLGIADMVAQYSEGFIRSAMPQQHRDFFCHLPFLIVGLVDDHGFPWALPLFGEKGFIQSPNSTRLTLAAKPLLTEALQLDFSEGQKIGVLGIQLHSRRRNRMNGVIADITDAGFSIDVEQSFGNCPQYIQTRVLEWTQQDRLQHDFADVAVESTIPAHMRTFLEQADTFFITSRTKTFDDDNRSGIDASHRGGKPGFIKTVDNTLYFPDFSGNKFFNTLGNIESDGRVGLFFPDYGTGDAYFIAGHAQILWDDPAIQSYEGAERIIKITVEKAVAVAEFMPMTGDLIDFSPVLDYTGVWQDAEAKAQTSSRTTMKPYQLIKKRKESDTITSFYFATPNKAEVDEHIAGQFLPIQVTLPVQVPEQEQLVNRSYTLSSMPNKKTLRISVKREEQGAVSRYLHDTLQVGETIMAGKPAGQFVLQNTDNAVVFLSGGVGITPMIAMLEGLICSVENGMANGEKPRPVWFIHATQNSATQAFSAYLQVLEAQYEWLHTHIVYSAPLATDALGQTHQSEGIISMELLKRILSFDLYDFYLCGPEGFMRALYAGLTKTGVAKTNIHYEFFGQGSIEETEESTTENEAEQAKVVFANSQITQEWTPNDGTLLEFAEKQGLNPLHSCRSGACGACATKITSGQVTYATPPSFQAEAGEVLICCAKPAAGTDDIQLEL
ncbi:2Fe-2S iron-sulfur cluster binding domain-containing protein [Marinomonas agarivorans]|nr:2Fe-2S iron-sulfur cluster binding domain-containing protein [Marinomonas agarivorans]